MAKRILIVEDEPSVADNITYALSTEGFDPVWCSTGKEGLDVLQGYLLAGQSSEDGIQAQLKPGRLRKQVKSGGRSGPILVRPF